MECPGSLPGHFVTQTKVAKCIFKKMFALNQILKYIKAFYRIEFRFFYLFVIVAMLAVLIYFNYWQSLEEKYVMAGDTTLRHFIGYYLLYFTPFAIAFFIQPLFYKNCSYFKNHWFWIVLFIAPAFFSFRVNFNYQETIVKQIWEGEKLIFWLKCLSWVVRSLLILLLLYFFWRLKDKNNQPFYGTRALDSVRPYLGMLGIMIPLIVLASTQKDFLAMYPKAKFLYDMNLGHQPWRYVVYELCYGFDFVSIEFFFRGFLILSLIHICGKHCIIPAACFYCIIHFGKPMGEAISSFWGGLLLGIVSYNTRSVWGGLMVHLGIAWLMELGGWLVLALFNP